MSVKYVRVPVAGHVGDQSLQRALQKALKITFFKIWVPPRA